MNVDQVRSVLERVDLKNPPFPIALDVDGEYGSARLIARTLVPDRETGQSVRVIHTRPLWWHPSDRVEFEAWLLREIDALVRSVFVHEFEECYHVDGKRVRDPHAKDAG